MKKLTFISIGLSFVFLSFLVGLWLKPLSVDLSQGSLYTLSEGSVKLLKKLPEPVTLKLFYSKTAAAKGSDQIRPFNNHFQYVKETLELFVRHSGNRLRLQIVDPRPDTEEEEEAVIEGLKRFQLTDTETYLFGLVARADSGPKKVIEFFNPSEESNLEYDLAKLLASLHQGNKKRLGLLSGQVLQNSPLIFPKALEELYLVNYLAKDTSEIKDVDLLMVFGGKDLDEKALKAIDQYLVNGGKVILLADPLKLQSPGDDEVTPFAKMFAAWGVEVAEKKLVGDLNLSGVARVNPFSAPQRLLPLLNCDEKCLQQSKEVSVRNLKNTSFLYPGWVRKTRDLSGLEFYPLIQSSKEGSIYEDTGYGIQNPELLLSRFKKGDKPLALSGRLEGAFPKAFPDTKDPAEGKKGTLILIADQDFLMNEFAFRQSMLGVAPANDNLAFVLNNLDQLSGSEDLLSIRSKPSFRRPFELVERIQKEADEQTIGKVQEINQSISRFQSELNQLAQSADANNIGVIQSQGIARQKELQLKIAKLRRELREAKRAGRESVEQLGSWLYFLNVGFAPLLIVAIYLWPRRKSKVQNKGVVYESIHTT